MTFKRDFKEQMVHEWADNYMDYAGLKKILQEIKSSEHKSHEHNQKQPRRDDKSYAIISLESAFYGLHLEHSNHGRIEEGDIEDHHQVIDVKKLEHGSSGKLYKTHFLKSHEEGGEAEARFFQKLDEEQNKVNPFYKDQVQALLEHEEALFNKQMEALIALRAKMKSPDIEMQNLSSSSAEKMDHDANHGEEGRNNYNRRSLGNPGPSKD